MKRVKISFRGLAIPQKIEKARTLVSKMTGNAAFATPDPTLTDVSKGADDLETAYADAQQGGKTKTALMHQQETKLTVLITALAAYVQGSSRGDEVIILSSGFDVVGKTATHTSPLLAPVGLVVTNGVLEGQLLLNWKKTKGGVSYVIQQADDPLNPETWETIGTSTKTKFTVSDLQAGKKYWFHVAAIGTPGVGAFSDPACKMSL